MTKPFLSFVAGLALAVPGAAHANVEAHPLSASIAADGVPAPYASALQALLGALSAKEAKALWKAGVTPEYAGSLGRLFASITPDELLSLHRMGITPDTVLAYRRVGIADAATVIKLRSRQITPRMARELSANEFMRRPFETMNPPLP